MTKINADESGSTPLVMPESNPNPGTSATPDVLRDAEEPSPLLLLHSAVLRMSIPPHGRTPDPELVDRLLALLPPDVLASARELALQSRLPTPPPKTSTVKIGDVTLRFVKRDDYDADRGPWTSADTERGRAAWQAALDAGGREICERWSADVRSGARVVPYDSDPEATMWAVFGEDGLVDAVGPTIGDTMRSYLAGTAEYFCEVDCMADSGMEPPDSPEAWWALLDTWRRRPAFYRIVGPARGMSDLRRNG